MVDQRVEAQQPAKESDQPPDQQRDEPPDQQPDQQPDEPPDQQPDQQRDQIRAAFYASSGTGWRGWWTVLHPPYTAWHLAYVVIGASLAPSVNWGTLGATLGAFFLAVGVAAHALDELNGRPLRTSIPSSHLVGAAAASLSLAVALGVGGVVRLGIGLVPFIGVGAFLVVAYDLELVGGRLHNDATFALAWGAFPVLTAYFAQAGTIGFTAVAAAAGAFALSGAQRHLSAPARTLRRHVVEVSGSLTLADGTSRALTREVLLAPLERALKALCWAVVALAVALAVSRLS
ncbi:MAG: hypothetical protein ACRDWV_03280 [Acidimicrobiales bacterium]